MGVDMEKQSSRSISLLKQYWIWLLPLIIGALYIPFWNNTPQITTLNALFTSLAFSGIVITIYYQRKDNDDFLFERYFETAMNESIKKIEKLEITIDNKKYLSHQGIDAIHRSIIEIINIVEQYDTSDTKTDKEIIIKRINNINSLLTYISPIYSGIFACGLEAKNKYENSKNEYNLLRANNLILSAISPFSFLPAAMSLYANTIKHDYINKIANIYWVKNIKYCLIVREMFFLSNIEEERTLRAERFDLVFDQAKRRATPYFREETEEDGK